MSEKPKPATPDELTKSEGIILTEAELSRATGGTKNSKSSTKDAVAGDLSATVKFKYSPE